MELGLTGRRVLITGGTRGIGRAAVLAFAKAGAGVVVTYRNDEANAETLEQELCEIDVKHRVVRSDVTKAIDVHQLVQTCRETLGGLDVVVNNVGIDGHEPAATLSLADWQHMLRTNLTGAHLVTQYCLEIMERGASVVNVSASVAQRGLPGKAHYTAAKAGLHGLTRSLAKELGPDGIRVNTIAPGLIETEPDAGLPAPVAERFRAMNPLGRLGTSDEVANVVLFLASNHASYVHGASIAIDGGL
ncbi:MAG TPA: SDR family NAD(P)-dependent oxidoreductase [Actinophytocola sp.]|jgi:3-oxoacyl-[acyl-carrier protein] reductase|uniref:SDR family NAD(P)-dependent oxidoreductase n=1 Tax=Actinophytocola sp. TaxID=1872138 RepID=UPI002DF87BFE|nr:SDR family NAD(P)-dependent oxidoreductase [Actinophytocola sp.]